MKLATVALISLFIGCLGAQTTQTTRTTTETKTTTANADYSGTLIDQACVTSHSQHKESDSDDNSTRSTETTKVVTECPVTTSTTSFGLLTPEGRVVRFDDAGNTRVVEMVKSNKDWRNYIEGKKPVRVHVVGNANGDVIVVKEIR
jgi:hypothetical protein